MRSLFPITHKGKLAALSLPFTHGLAIVGTIKTNFITERVFRVLANAATSDVETSALCRF